MLTTFRIRRPLNFVAFRFCSQGVTKDTQIDRNAIDKSDKRGVNDLKDEEKWTDDTEGGKKTGDNPLRFPEYGNKPKGPEPTRFGDWQYKGDIMETELSKEFTDPVSTIDNGYLDTAMQPDYVDSWGGGNKKIHGMIVRLVPNRKGAVPTELNAGVIQMRMVLVAGVISASLRIEKNESAEDDEDEANSNMARIFLSVKVAPGEDSFVSDLNKAIIDGSDGSFKLGNVDFWENHNANNRSGKDTPEEKSTEFAESENDNADDGMYLDDDEKLASRVTGGKKGGKASKRRPWSMFNPSSALGLNSVFNSADLLEMVEYDSDEAEARKQEAAAGSSKAAPSGSTEDEEAAATAPPPTVSRFGIFRRLFG